MTAQMRSRTMNPWLLVLVLAVTASLALVVAQKSHTRT
jgi:hypothetical protein